jgi:hypothetical protein
MVDMGRKGIQDVVGLKWDDQADQKVRSRWRPLPPAVLRARAWKQQADKQLLRRRV